MRDDLQPLTDGALERAQRLLGHWTGSDNTKARPTRRRFNAAILGGCTHEEIAKELGVTPQRVQQIEQAALRKLRRNLVAMSLTADDLTPDRHGWKPR